MDVRTWVNDHLIKLAGASDSTTVDFVLATTQSAKTAAGLNGKLSAFLEGSAADIQAFSSDLYDRQKPPSNGTSTHTPTARDVRKPKAKSSRKKYALVDMEEGRGDSLAAVEAMPSPKRPRDKDDRDERRWSKKIRRRHDESFDERWKDEEPRPEEEEMFPEPSPKRVKVEEPNGSPRRSRTPEPVEDEYVRDRRKKEEFEKRLREKERANKVKSSDGMSSAKEAREPQKADNSDLRLQSRQSYLAKREKERLMLFRQQVQEQDTEERNNLNLSVAERADFQRDRDMLRLAEERLRIDDHTDGYMLPADYIDEKGKLDRKRKEQALSGRYQDRETYISEHDLWDREQAEKAKAQISRAEIVDEGQYEFVFDEAQQVNFTMEEVKGGKAHKRMTHEQRILQQQLNAAEQKAKTIEETRKSLPMFQYRESLVEAIKDNQFLVVVAETGSGKTTQLPQYLYEEGYAKNGMKIGCTQPRRVAAMSVAARVAEEVGCKVGKQVGYTIRFEDKTSDDTAIQYMTDGMLLRACLTDPMLEGYSCLMIDEAHERTISTDVLFGIIKDVAKARPDLKVLITSATLNAKKFADYFSDCPIFSVPGRTFPVDIYHTTHPEANWLNAMITTTFQIHLAQPDGDILCFCTGQEEIEAVEANLTETSRKLGSRVKELIICPIYANLPTDLQAKIFEPTPPNARKVVLATNIAETSLTIDGIVYVIDPGFVKQNSFSPRTGISSLTSVPISKASANQRAGRAGRNRPGKCFRLYTQHAHDNELDEDTVPEIQRSDLSAVILTLKSLGIHDLISWDFLDPPPPDTIIRALELLYALGALNDRGEISRIGRAMAELPLNPMLSKSIIAADKLSCVDEIVTIASILPESGAIFFRPKDKRLHADSAHARFTIKDGGDHLTLLNIFNQWADSDFSPLWCKENFLQYRSLVRARDVRDQLVKLCDRIEVTVSSIGASEIPIIARAVTAGFFPNCARLQKGGDSYRTVKSGLTVSMHPSSVLAEKRRGQEQNQVKPPRWILFNEIVLTTKEWARGCIEIQPDWLVQAAPHYYTKDSIEKLGVERKMPKGQGAVASKF